MKKTKIVLSLLLAAVTVLACAVCLLPINAEAAAEDAYIYGDATKLTGLKAEYTVGDPINVAAVGSGNAFVGIYKTMDVGSSYWHYVDSSKSGGVGSGVTADVTQGNELYPGEYIVRLMPDDGDHCTATAWAVINVKPKSGQSYDADALVQGPDKSKLSVPKATYEVGEAINVSGIGSGKDWIGLYKIGKQASSQYFYITTPGSGVAKDITYGSDLEPGQYVIRLMPNDTSAHGKATAWAVITVGMDGEGATVYGDASKLTGLKAEYTVGEKINVAAIASGNAFVGIYRPIDYGSSYWHYVDSSKSGGVGSGVTADLTQGNELYPGEYIVRLMPDDGNHTIATAWAKITVKPKSGQSYDASALVQGPGKSNLSVPKATYQAGEAINVTATGTGNAWVGIYKLCTQSYLHYYWIDEAKGGVGSGVARDITDSMVLEPGEYVIRLMPTASEAHKTATAWAVITVTAAPDDVLKKPTSATYKLDNDTDGYAAGTVTVTMPEYQPGNRRDIVMYWANDNGKLPGYTSLAKFKVTGLTTTFEIPDHVVIPAGATKLLVYAQQTFTGKLSDCITIDLPANAAFQNTSELVMEFQIISDIHVTTDNTNRGAVNFRQALNDIKQNSPNSQGIFIVGDLINSRYQQDGKADVYAAEYANMQAIYDSISGLPNMYLGIGNHDIWNQARSLSEAEAIFYQYAKLPDGTNVTDTSYDFWLDGYHFVFLGTDYFDLLTAKFSDATLSWLDETLAEDRDAEKPTFLLLHQSIYNTIAGSLPGQDWDGVVEESAVKLKKILNKYPEVVMFNGHSHWEMDSVMNMYPATSELNINVFNTAAVAYLYSSYDSVFGESLGSGSQGYYIRIYEDKLMVLAKDFTTGEWIPSAQYCVQYKDAPNTEVGGGNDNTGGGNNNSGNGGNSSNGDSVDPTVPSTPGATYDPSTPGATYDPTDPNAPSTPEKGEGSKNGSKTMNPILIVCIIVAVLAAAGVGVFAILLLKKKKAE